MEHVGSNSAPEIAALLVALREHLELAEEHRRKSYEHYVRAKEAAHGLRSLEVPLRDIAEAAGCKHPKILKLLNWDGTVGTTPFAGKRDIGQGVRRALRERPDVIIEEALTDPATARWIIRRLERGLAKLGKRRVAKPAEGNPEEHASVLRPFDIIKMGDHVLAVGDSTHPHTKLELLTHAGLEYVREYFRASAIEEDGKGDGEMDVVLLTDQPYGQNERSVDNDDRANWGEVYGLFKPVGGFIFCAFHPPIFREAENGIYDAGGEPVDYMLWEKTGGRLWEGNRVQNRLEALIYFERTGSPWQRGRDAFSSLLLRADASGTAREERARMGGGDSVTKPIDLLEKLIERITRPNDIVLDPFARSGTTLIACQRLGRRFIGSELKPKHAERAVRNWLAEPGVGDAIVHRDFAVPPSRSFLDLVANPKWDDGIDPVWKV